MFFLAETIITWRFYENKQLLVAVLLCIRRGNHVSRTLLNAIRRFYEKEENRKAFEIWQAERQKLQLNNKKLRINHSFGEQKKVAIYGEAGEKS